MASFITSITEFSDSDNRRTYQVSGHTVVKPKLVIQKRKVPASPSAIAESDLTVVYGTVDATGLPLASKVAIGANVRYPANAASADITAALVAFRDFVASDQFTNLVNSQGYIA